MIRQLRVFFLALLAAGVLSLAAAPPSCAEPARTATDTIREAINNILDIIKNPDISDPDQRGALLQQVEDIAYTVFDFEEFSAYTVGLHWREFTPDQKSRFIDAFASLLRALYVDRLEGYGGGEVEFLREIKSTRGDKAEVQTMVQLKDKPVSVSYRLLVKGDAWKVYDVIIADMSLVVYYRGQFKEVIAQNDAEILIARVEAAAAEIRRQNRTGT
jgi:phospholipid transport system substrate-binding protein